jgi:GNAT superfamily N-acetyltransferase
MNNSFTLDPILEEPDYSDPVWVRTGTRSPSNTAALAFDESKHPRSDDGKFGSGGSGSDDEVRDNTISDNAEKWKNKNNTFQEHKDSWKEVSKHGDFTILHTPFLSGIKSLPHESGEGEMVAVDKQGKVVGSLYFAPHQLTSKTENEGAVEVHPDFRRKGIASAMYDAVQTLTAKPMKPAPSHTKDAEEFWKSRQAKKESASSSKLSAKTAILAFDESKHPRSDDGEFGSKGGGASKKKDATAKKEKTNRPLPSKKTPQCDERCRRAKAAHVMVDKTIQRYAEEHNEPRAAKKLGGISFPNSEPIDIAIAGDNGVVKHGIELKTMVKNANNKITMKKDARERKKSWELKNKAQIHTVVLDDSAVMNAKGEGKHDESKRKIYYANGYGSFRIGSLHEVKGGWDEVKTLMNTPYEKLPKGAQKRKKLPIGAKKP